MTHKAESRHVIITREKGVVGSDTEQFEIVVDGQLVLKMTVFAGYQPVAPLLARLVRVFLNDP